jgi:hypothetical protein
MYEDRLRYLRIMQESPEKGGSDKVKADAPAEQEHQHEVELATTED